MTHEQDLRIALEALREGLINPSQLAKAAQAWAENPSFHLTELLVAQGSLNPHSRNTLESELTQDITPSHAQHPPAESTTALDPNATQSLPNPVDTARAEPSTLPDPSSQDPAATWISAAADSPERYQYLRHIASGGLGEVILALDRHLGREVAIKSIRDNIADRADFLTRFLDEARIHSRLEHPHIVPLYDLIEHTSSSNTFYTMRFVQGRTLDQAIALYHAKREKHEHSPIDLRDLLDALICVCRATAYAHAKHILHRDLKGQNIILGEFGEVFLLDWGLAKQVLAPAATPATPAHPLSSTDIFNSPVELTVEGHIIGTPAYIAPEQIAGEPATPRSDIYALGIILYRILTSRPPFVGGTPLDIILRARSETPAPPRTLIPSIPRPLEAICLKAIARNPDDRYNSPLDLADDLKRWLADEPVLAYPEPWTDRLRRWTKRHRSLAAAAAALLATSAIALAVSNLLIRSEQLRTEIARNQAQNNFNLARNALGAILVDVAQNNLPQIPGTVALRQNVATKASSLYKSLLNAPLPDPTFPTEAANAFRQLASIRRLAYDFPNAEADYTRAINLLEAQRNRDPNSPYLRATLAEFLIEFAVLLRMQGRIPDEIPLLNRAINLVRDLPAANPGSPLIQPRRIHARALGMLVTVQLLTDQPQDALAASKQTIALIESVPTLEGASPLEFFDRIWATGTLAPAYRALRQLDQAESAARAHLKHTRAFLDLAPDNNDRRYLHALAQADLAESLAPQPAKHPEALATLDAALAALDQLAQEFQGIPMYRLSLADALINRGLLHAAHAHPSPAQADARRARSLLETAGPESSLPPTQAQLGRALALLAQLAIQTNQPTEARSLLDEAERLTQAALQPNPKAPRERETLARIQTLRTQLKSDSPPANNPDQTP